MFQEMNMHCIDEYSNQKIEELGQGDLYIVDQANTSLINNSMLGQGVFDQMNQSTIDMNQMDVSIIRNDDFDGESPV